MLLLVSESHPMRGNRKKAFQMGYTYTPLRRQLRMPISDMMM